MKRRDFPLTLAGAGALFGQTATQTAPGPQPGPGEGDTIIRVGTSEVIAPTTRLIAKLLMAIASPRPCASRNSRNTNGKTA